MLKRFFIVLGCTAFFAASSSAGPILIQSDQDESLPLAAAIELGGDAPVFVLSRDIAGADLAALTALSHFDAVLLMNATLEDLAVDLAATRQYFTESHDVIDIFPFDIAAPASIEIYASGFQDTSGELGLISVSMDNNPWTDLAAQPGPLRVKNIFCGRFALKPGHHEFRLRSAHSTQAFRSGRVPRRYRLTSSDRLEKTRSYLSRSLNGARAYFASRATRFIWPVELDRSLKADLWIKTLAPTDDNSTGLREPHVTVDGNVIDLKNAKVLWEGPLGKGVRLFAVPVDLDAGTHAMGYGPEVDWVILAPKIPQRPSEPIRPVRIELQQINPTKWRAEIRDIQGPFWLIFLESYHPKWMLYPEEGPEFRDPVRSAFAREQAGSVEKEKLFVFSLRDARYFLRIPLAADHIKVQGYANGWLITPPSGTTTLSLTLFFRPQALFCIGVLISLFALVVSCALLATRAILKRRDT